MQQVKSLDGWCLFLDLLGVRYLAKASPTTLFYHFSEFFGQLETISATCEGCKVFTLSDSAFIYCKDLKPLIKLIKNLRASLFSEGIFFKGAICVGSADLRWPASGLEVYGVSFSGPGPSEAYAAQALLNGVGISIIRPKTKFEKELNEFNEAVKTGEIFTSAFVDGPPKREIISYFDVKLTANEIGKSFSYRAHGKNEESIKDRTAEGFNAVKRIVQAYWYAKHLDERTAVKFISFLVSIALNSDVSRIRYNEEKKSWTEATPLFIRAFIDEPATNSMTDAIFNPIYVIISCRIIASIKNELNSPTKKPDQLLEDLISNITISKILSKSLKRRGLMESIKRYPDDIISRQDADLLFTLFSRQKDWKSTSKTD